MSETSFGFLDAGEPLPFEDLFIPLVLDACAGLRQRAAVGQIALLQSEAHARWERYLLRRLCNAGAKAAFCQFQAFKTVRSVFNVAVVGGYRSADRLYREFVGLSPRERLRKLFEEFPALPDYCEVLVSNWIATVAEFLGRLETDRRNLDDCFGGEAFTGPVVSLQAGLSDSHHGGRCVVRLTFESGASLIYKPRSIAPEACFSDLLEQLNREAVPHMLRPARCWVQDGYGWMEDVKPRPCDKPAEIQAFYWRAGALLALVYLARGVDIHRENLIAAGEFPVIVDLEALWHPQEHVGVGDSPIATSVLRTGFLPQNDPQMGAIYGWNALGHRLTANFPATFWTSINQDDMMLERANRPLKNSHHLPVFAGTEYLARDFLPDILAGFRWVGGQALADHRKQENFQRWIHALLRCPRRRIYRSSLWYRAALEQVTAPSALREKKRVAADLTHLAQSIVPITEPEWRALQQLEIPWLAQEASQQSDPGISLPMRTMEEVFAQESLIVAAFSAFPGEEEYSSVDEPSSPRKVGGA